MTFPAPSVMCKLLLWSTLSVLLRNCQKFEGNKENLRFFEGSTVLWLAEFYLSLVIYLQEPKPLNVRHVHPSL